MTLDATSKTPGGAGMSLRERLRLLLLARVLIMTVFLAGVGALWFSKPQVTRTLLGDVTFVVLALAYAGTLLSAFLVRSIRSPFGLAYLQIIFDVLLITGALGALGGVSGPMALLYVLPIANAAGLLMLPGAIAAAAVSSVAYGALTLHAQHVMVASGATPGVDVMWPISLAAICFGSIAMGVGGVARRVAFAERELRVHRAEMGRLEELHRAMANGLECGILVTDCDGRVRSANPAAQQILSLPTASILGREVSWLVPLLESAEEDGDAGSHVECEQRVAAGESRRLRVGRNALRDTYGNSIGELVVLQDVTRIEQLEARLAEDEGSPLVLEEADGDDVDGEREGPGADDGLIGRCPQMRQISRLIDKVAVADATVLVTGESGTGKELVARAIHRRSPRSEGPFVVVNCGAIPESLIESELFGHAKGAFTGAVAEREGLFRRAHGGTIFLDEIGELSPALQVRLLRVLQDHKVAPVGGPAAVEVDVRVVAATNRVLEDLVKSGDYREDLYYRLAVISIDVPPLRERDQDVELLVEHFLRRAAERHAKSVRGVSAKAMALLLRHPYAGNVRELENVIEYAITLTDRDTVQEFDLPESVRGAPTGRSVRSSAGEATVYALDGGLLPVEDLAAAAGPDPWPEEGLSEIDGSTATARVRLPIDDGEGASLDEQLADKEKQMLLAALDRAAGVKKKAAGLLGINYRSFRHRLQKYGLDGHAESGLRSIERGSLPRETPH